MFDIRLDENHRNLISRLDDKYKNNIRSIKLVLEYEKSPFGPQEKYYPEYDDRDLLGNLMKFEESSENNDYIVLDSWYRKAVLLFDLNLDSLSLDVTDAYSPDSGFMGMKFARHAPPFTYGIPSNFEVIAPSSTIAKGIRQVIVDTDNSTFW